MTLDLYSLCPSGNGKKIKFCKCQDSLSELDRIQTMVGGGQIVPALDRLNRMLTEHPDAACALAIKGRILLGLGEFDLLAENAERFVRLQPTNPQALTQRAISQIAHHQLGEATESILEAVAESGRQVDSFVLEAVTMLANQLLESGQFLTARAFATMALMAEGFEGREMAAGLLEEMNTQPAVNHLLKALPSHRPRPEVAEWGERFDEALGLLRNHRINLANSKFASLARTYPNEPSILIGLLTCAIWRADVEAQVDCFQRLSRCEKLERTERGKFLAMAWLCEPGLQSVCVEMTSLSADLDNVAHDEESLRANTYFAALPDDSLRSLVARDDEVPPRSGFQLLDQPLPTSEESLNADNLPETLALVLVYGKQTDRPARMVVKTVLPMFLEVVRKTLAEALEKLPWVEQVDQKVPFVMASDPRPAWADKPAFRANLESVLAEFRKSRFAHRMALQPIPALRQRSLRDAAGDESLSLEREAIVRLLESTESLAQDPELLDQLRREANVSPLPPLVVITSDDLEAVENSDLPRVDCTQLDTEGLQYMLTRARFLRMMAVQRRAATEALTREAVMSDSAIGSMVYSAMVESSSSPQEALHWITEAKTYCAKSAADAANFLLLELGQRLRAGDVQGFQEVIRILTTEYRNREDVMQVLQQMLVSLGLINPDGTPRRAPGRPAAVAAEPTSTSGGIWTPDAGAPPAAAPSAGSASGKLWIPGMD